MFTNGEKKEAELNPSASTPSRIFELEDHTDLDSFEAQEMPTDRVLLRMGALSILLGTLISTVAGFFHGGGAHPEDLAATLPAYAANANWEVVHLAQFVGNTLLLVGFLALYRSIIAVTGTGASAALARMGIVVAVIAEGIYAINQAVDAIANKFVAQQWVNAAPDEKAVALQVADAVRHIEIGTSSFWQLSVGITLLFFGLAIALSRGMMAASRVEAEQSEQAAQVLQSELASLSSNSTYRVIEGSDHASVITNQHHAQQTSEEILKVLEAVQTGQPLAEQVSERRN